ncbi:homocysteine methyltransferase [Roseovarius albus]|uniref:Homocysteine methyltransferase n=1 Tax=Roseovarius albus TaxID=1247867 RepID=A0A1X6YXD1_9RHOB|nr:homocysteine S-methyltransferase family protein [Roseovarius albus]SLN34456.1 homocysteine methyltransferase [Roseovarius albus]
MKANTTPFERFLSLGKLALSDGGLETSMIFHEGFDLPEFSSMPLLESDAGRAALNRYFDAYLAVAEKSGTGFMLDTASWRSGIYWAKFLDRTEDDMLAGCRVSVQFASSVRDRWADRVDPIVINGAVGPAGDGYTISHAYTADAARAVHHPQIAAMAEAGADMISAVTMTHSREAMGIARSCLDLDMPCVIGFTVETDGKLPSGESIGEAIAAVDADSCGWPIYYMINCAHPDHFDRALYRNFSWIYRIGAIRCNASRCSHAELDEATELDDGDPVEFGRLNANLARVLPNLRMLGGCCGTDHRHIAETAQACVHLDPQAPATASI